MHVYIITPYQHCTTIIPRISHKFRHNAGAAQAQRRQRRHHAAATRHNTATTQAHRRHTATTPRTTHAQSPNRNTLTLDALRIITTQAMPTT